MQFTLDSITHVVTILEEIHKGKTVSYNSIYIEDLTKLTKNSDTYYFGIISFGNNVPRGKLMNGSDVEIIRAFENSQIVDVFEYVLCHDNTDSLVSSPLGHFRGFEITIR